MPTGTCALTTTFVPSRRMEVIAGESPAEARRLMRNNPTAADHQPGQRTGMCCVFIKQLRETLLPPVVGPELTAPNPARQGAGFTILPNRPGGVRNKKSPDRSSRREFSTP